MSITGVAPLPTLLVLAFGALVVSGCGVNVDFGGDTTRRIERETLPAGDVREVEIHTTNGRVDVVASSEAEEITVEAIMQESREGDADFSVSLQDADATVSIDGECDAGWGRSCSVGFVVTVPGGVDVDATTTNGAIVIDGVSGSVEAHTTNGAVTGNDLASRDVTARTTNGRVRLLFDDAPSDVEVRTSNGSIDVMVPDDGTEYDVDADSNNGSVDVDLPTGDSGHQVTARTTNGRIDIDTRA